MEYALEMQNIIKEFPGVRALDGVTFQVKKGEIHALVGENGAGKSTLMKVLSGVYPYGTYQGTIVVHGKERQFHHITDSERAGIAIIYQELTLIKQMTIAENIYLGNENVQNGIINWNETYRKTEELLRMVGLPLSPATMVGELGVGSQQLVEIAKALSKNASILILDEPTAALTETESEKLLGILRQLKAKGVTCIFISHRLPEVLEIADTITVLRDGKTIITDRKENFDENRLICHMVGREITNVYPRVPHKAKEVVLEVRNWTVYDPDGERKVCDNINFEVRRGEILGLGGLMGAGRTELVMSLFGVWGKVVSGEIRLNGQKIAIRSAHDAIRYGISLLSEDRKRYGLVLGMDVKRNMTLASLSTFAHWGVINKNEEIKQTQYYVQKLRVKTPTIEQEVRNLSGGNQQKVIIGKWLLTKPKVLFLDEPTRGIDVGAKYEIYNLMNALVDEGVCVVMISSELPELLGMSDRILVIHQGRITGELEASKATQETVMYYATGGTGEAPVAC
ncbi:D-xylose ABC transporter, ATP-binding protein XylG [Brevinematales bacterium NS]|nr:D-xylose ABC transporter, ATP-binding protein XylG [Brevinematales bacterium NS]